jgi:translation initiation factor 3 subunit C
VIILFIYLFLIILIKFVKASLDEPTQTVIMHRTEPTKLQTLALQLSEKITTLMDQTERMIQIKGGEMSAFFTRNRKNLFFIDLFTNLIIKQK